MATYKVLQDIEAEDKLIGPLTLRQCIYAGIAAVAAWLMFIVIHKHAPYLALIFLPFFGFGTFFAVPWKSEQPTEVWALAKVRFLLKPRKRIWDQSGVKELVTVTAPKLAEDPRRARHLSENEVHSRLKALADTIDSRGWAVKNAPIDLYTQPTDFLSSDRLIAPTAMPREVAGFSESSGDDMFDTQSNPLARQLDEKINASTNTRHQEAMALLSNPAAAAQPQNNWYGTPAASQTPMVAPVTQAVITPTSPLSAPQNTAATPAAQQPQPSYAHLRVIQPLSAQTTAPLPVQTTPTQPAQNQTTTVTPPVNPAILELANNNDLNVATIAREAHHINPDANDEVIVSLH